VSFDTWIHLLEFVLVGGIGLVTWWTVKKTRS